MLRLSTVHRGGLGAIVALCVAALIPAAAHAADFKRCSPVVNPYPDTRYEGANLHHIRALGVTCKRARKVARRAHRKALGRPLPADGVREFDWRRWEVVGDIRGDTDRYRARRGDDRVRWRF
jgi:hypothetical protein